MIYLFENKQEINGKTRRCIKIGYTNKDNIKLRERSYRTSSGPGGFKRLGTREGSVMLEKMFHLKYRDKLLINEDTGRLSEWCLRNQKLIDAFFTETEESLGNFLWKHRETYLLPYIKRKNIGKASLVYRHLENLNKKEIDDVDKVIKICLNNIKNCTTH